MKLLSRDFTLKEKILLLILTLLLLGMGYYLLIDQPVRSGIAAANSEKDALQTELDAVLVRIGQLKKMEKELDELSGKQHLSRMESYNNSKAEISFLNDVLSDTVQYSIAFSEVKRNADQIRRDFTLQFQTENYEAACRILEALHNSEYRCLIGDVYCSADENKDLQSGMVTVSATATFYETMAGGTVDAGLPEDEGKVYEDSEEE